QAEVAGRAAVEEAVGAEARADEPAEDQPGGQAPGPGGDGGLPAVAPGLHGGGEEEGAVEGVGEDGDGDLAHDVAAPHPVAPQPPGPPDPLAALDQLGRHAEG